MKFELFKILREYANLTLSLINSEKSSVLVFVSLFDGMFVDCEYPLSQILLSFEDKHKELEEERDEENGAFARWNSFSSPDGIKMLILSRRCFELTKPYHHSMKT